MSGIVTPVALATEESPEYNEGTANGLSIDLDGGLRVNVMGASFDVTTLGTIGAIDDTAEPDPAENATVIAALKGVNENLETLIAAIGAAGDAAGANTVIGQLKQIVVNTA